VQQPAGLFHISFLVDILPSIVQPKDLTLFCGRTGSRILRVLEGNPSDHQGHKGFRVDLDATGVNGYVQPPRIPETRIFTDTLMMWSMNKDLDINGLPVFFHLVRHNLAHLDLPEIDGLANIQ